LSDLVNLSIAEYKRQIRLITKYCAELGALAIFLGFCGFLLAGARTAIEALDDAITAFTLGGGSLNVSGYSRAIAVALSLAGVVFISLIVSIITLVVQEKSMLKVAVLVFSKEYRDAKENPR